MLKLKNFGITYNDGVLFENINLEAARGEIIVVSGQSGCGKSSLIKAINGIIEESDGIRLNGDIELNGESILKTGIASRSRNISTVFQNPKTQFYCINTTDELALALENRNMQKDEIVATIGEYAQSLNTKHLLNRNIFTLSGGEKQLVAITATACMNNAIYLFDEPSASLDRASIALLKDTLLQLKSMGKIIIVAEHRLYYLAEIMSKLVILQNKAAVVFDKHALGGQLLKEIETEYQLRSFKEITRADLGHLKLQTVSLNLGGCYEDGGCLLSCRDFRACYDKQKILDVSISFSSGIHFIIGENGVGKSTFIKKMSGLTKGKGNTFFNGSKITKSYKHISMIMQDVNYQLFTDSVWQEISIVSSDNALKTSVLAELDLYDKRDLHPQILSGGEKQRLLMGITNISGKDVVILDEPTSGLCKTKMIKMIEYLHNMSDMGRVVIVITHDYELINKCGGTILEFVR